MELKIDRITKQYGDKTAVNNISCVLRPGVTGLLGANGAGKTTLMRMICGLIKPTSGRIRLRQYDVEDDAYRNLLGYLPQDFGYYPEFTGMQRRITGRRKKQMCRSHLCIREIPVCQSKGVGTLLMKAVETFIPEMIRPGWAVSLELISTKEAIPFYLGKGFEERPCDWHGPGMFKMVKKEDDTTSLW